MRLGSFLIGLFCGFLAFYVYRLNKEFQSKREWSAVQAAELRYRDVKSSERVQFLAVDELGVAIGILPRGGGQRAWFLARALAGEMIKIIPQLDGKVTLRLSQDELAFILKSAEVSPDVRTFLSNSAD